MGDGSFYWLEELTLDRVYLGPWVQPLPLCGFGPDEQNPWLEELATQITEELKLRRMLSLTRHFDRPPESPNQWLKPLCYQIILSCCDSEMLGELEARIERSRRWSRRRPASPTIFQSGLLALFAHDADILIERDRSRMAKEMMHGFRNYISPAQLNDFNARYTSSKLSSTNASRVEPKYHSWIIEQRARFSLSCRHIDSYRGAYPKKIELDSEKVAEKISNKRDKSISHSRDELWD